MAVEGLKSENGGIAFLVAAGIVAEIVAKVNSSPQTTELNAEKRAPTLMKWVHIGMVEASLLLLAAMYFGKENTVPFIAGGAAELGITYAEYVYAKHCGLNSSEPGTEYY